MEKYEYAYEYANGAADTFRDWGFSILVFMTKA